jgi:hypothetical protein
MEKLNQDLFNDQELEARDSRVMAGATCSQPARTLTGCVGQLCAGLDQPCADLDA